MRKIALFLLLGCFALPTTSCDEACEIIDKADLVMEKVGMLTAVIPTNSSFALASVIKNFASQACSTRTAGKSITGYGVQYRKNSSEVWKPTAFNVDGQQVSNLNQPTDEMKSNSGVELQSSYKFTTPGQYRFEVGSDATQIIDERSETNNAGSSPDGRMGDRVQSNPMDHASQFNTIVTVVPGPDYKPGEGEFTKDGLPVVKFLGYKSTVIK